MKHIVKIEYDSSIKDDEVHIKVSPTNKNVEEIIGSIENNVSTIIGKKDDRIYFINRNEIEMIYSMNNDVFAYYENSEYKIKYKLYEIEETFNSKLFLRISKSTIVNIKKIDYVSPSLNRLLLFKMESGQELYSSRSFNKIIKQKLGV